MKKFLIIIPIVIFSCSAYGQLRSGHLYSPQKVAPDSSLAQLSFVPANFDAFLSDLPPYSEYERKSYSKTLRTTGWLLKHVVLRNKFEDFGSYPPVSMADFDTHTVSEYVGLYKSDSPYFNK